MQKQALVIGASGGIGAAMRQHLDNDPAYDTVIGLSRRPDRLDITDEASVAAAAERLHDHVFDLIVVATGVLSPTPSTPEKSFRDVDADGLSRTFANNAFGVAFIIKHFAPLLAKGRRAVFAALSARVGSIGDNQLGGWVSYRASKAALNQIMKCAAIEYGRTRDQAIFASLHPGTVETALSQPFARGRFTATADEAAAKLRRVLDELSPEQSGGFFAYDGSEIAW